MKVLFLDIDGVLKEESYKAAFQDECFARLKRIIDATDASINTFFTIFSNYSCII